MVALRHLALETYFNAQGIKKKKRKVVRQKDISPLDLGLRFVLVISLADAKKDDVKRR